MRVAVFSDAHSNIDTMKLAVKEIDNNIDYILYSGDGVEKVLNSEIADQFEIIAIRGNCDYSSKLPLERIVELADKKILITHGNRYKIKRGLDLLYYKAKEKDVDLVVFGHTHCRYAQKQDGILFFNPGSINRPRDNHPPSYGILEFHHTRIEYKHYDFIR